MDLCVRIRNVYPKESVTWKDPVMAQTPSAMYLNTTTATIVMIWLRSANQVVQTTQIVHRFDHEFLAIKNG